MQVFKMEHQSTIAGDEGKEKTALWIVHQFYWPSMFKDTKRHCQSCPKWQRVAKKETKTTQ